MRAATPDWIANFSAAADQSTRKIATTSPRSCVMDSAAASKPATPFTISASVAQWITWPTNPNLNNEDADFISCPHLSRSTCDCRHECALLCEAIDRDTARPADR